MNLDSPILLKKHRRVRAPNEDEFVWCDKDNRLKCAIGILTAEGAVDCVLLRHCDIESHRGHGHFWPGYYGRKWRWYPGERSIGDFDGEKFNVEETDAIERSILKEIAKYQKFEKHVET